MPNLRKFAAFDYLAVRFPKDQTVLHYRSLNKRLEQNIQHIPGSNTNGEAISKLEPFKRKRKFSKISDVIIEESLYPNAIPKGSTGQAVLKGINFAKFANLS